MASSDEKKQAQAPALDFNALVLERAEITAAIARLAPIARGEAKVVHPLHDPR